MINNYNNNNNYYYNNIINIGNLFIGKFIYIYEYLFISDF